MKRRNIFGIIIAGAAAGSVAGLFGAGGGMILVPLLTLLTNTKEEQVFPASVSITLPICVIILLTRFQEIATAFHIAVPYIIGSIPGGILAGILGKYIPTKWLHRGLGLLIIWGGIRYLCW